MNTMVPGQKAEMMGKVVTQDVYQNITKDNFLTLFIINQITVYKSQHWTTDSCYSLKQMSNLSKSVLWDSGWVF